MVDPQFAPGEREELLALTHALFESLPSEAAEIALRVYMRSRWPHLGREHLSVSCTSSSICRSNLACQCAWVSAEIRVHVRSSDCSTADSLTPSARPT